MPFTISHAAAALPVHRWTGQRLPLAALMIGCMSPDFAYFMPGEGPSRVATHDLAGIFWFCWPTSVIVWLTFVYVLERPTIALIPEAWRSRITPSARPLTFKRFAAASVAILIGAVSHICWDLFTHAGSPLVHALPLLRGKVVVIEGASIRFYWMLQHLSSLLGGLVLVIWGFRKLRPGGPPALPGLTTSTATRVVAILLVGVATTGLALAGFAAFPDYILEARLFFLAVGGMTGFALGWLVVALCIHLQWRSARLATQAERY